MLDKQCRNFVENGHVGGGTLENRKAPDFAIFQEISFPEPDRSPLVLRGESCSVNAGYGGDYCIYADGGRGLIRGRRLPSAMNRINQSVKL